MIYYLVTAPFTHTMQAFLDHWGGDLARRIRVVTYDEAARAGELPLGTYIFSDLERLLPSQRRIAEHVWNCLDSAGARLLNHPMRTLLRYDLLTTLHRLGRNSFRVARATEPPNGLRYPVFLRLENDHMGSLSEFIDSPRKLDETVTGARMRGYPAPDMIVVEYCDTADAGGVYRKYAAFMVGGRVVACHIDCSRKWVVKDSDMVNEDTVRDELRYIEANPHREWLEETFAIGRVDYGRIDYSIDRQGKPQVWEINTNPIVINPPAKYVAIHLPVKQLFAERIRPALEAIDSDGATRSVMVEIPAALCAESAREKRRRAVTMARRTIVWHALRKGPILAMRRVVKPLWVPFAPLFSRWMRSNRGNNTLVFNWFAVSSALFELLPAFQ